ncbi:MAG TPA: zf-HC2 domain-containing protein [Thermoanaerobaculia bacterium]|jgi:tetratricopeptide (TPR) repeat protein|nr:zf-HC2 domain-containing protein [Thermoanaerobaculia bacterium]
MTMLLAHPESESLARFVEGTLDESERAAIVQHIADCDDCRILVVDAAEFIEPAKTESHSWWMQIAAAVVVAVSVASFWYLSRDPLAPMIEASSHLSARPTEARLTGFSYVALNRKRGGGESDIDIPSLRLEQEIGDVLDRRGDNVKTLHAKGIAHLLAASTAKEPNEIRSERSNAVALLQAAADRAPDNAAYQTDLAAALLTVGDKNSRDLAFAHLKKALAIDPRNPEALFNQALALRDSNQALPLQHSNPKAAIAAFQRYLAVDPSSPWADEARTKLENLQEPP